MSTTETQLIAIEDYNLAHLFDPDQKELVEKFIKHVEKSALSEVCDASTEEGRKRIWNIKNQVVAVEKVVDEYGKKIQADAKAVVDQTNKIRKGYRDHLQSIKDAVMKPRVEWEEKKAARQKKHRDMIKHFEELGFPMIDVNSSLEDRKILSEQNLHLLIKSYEATRGKFEEFENDAETVYENGFNNLNDQIAALSDQIEKDKRLAELEAKEQARLEEEKAEQLRKEGEERARKKLEEEQAKKVSEPIIVPNSMEKPLDPSPSVLPMDPTPEEPNQFDNQQAKRERMKQVNRAALNAIVKEAGVTEEDAKNIITAIIRGQIPNITIQY